MMNNCKRRRPYLLQNDDQQKRKCNRFMSKIHFDKSTAIIVLFVAVFLFPYQYQVLADDITHIVNDEELIPDYVQPIPEEETQLSENSELKTMANISYEKNVTNIELNRTYTGFVVDNDVSTESHHEVYEHLKTEEEVNTSIPPISQEKHFNSAEDTVEVNNNIYTDVEERAENDILPDLINSNHEITISTDNLEESIRNSVKNEVELERSLESSPVMEILKDLPEAEIRKTLTDDIMSLDQENFDKKFILLAGEENSEPVPIPEVKIVSMENISKIVESSEISTETPRDSRNLKIQEAENSNESSNVTDPEQLEVESSKVDNSSVILGIPLENKNSENSGYIIKVKETDLTENINQEPNEEISNIEEVDLTVTETSYEPPTNVNSSPNDFSILIDEEIEDKALSIVLNETYSTAEPYSGEENPIRIEDNVELTTEEQVEIFTVIPEELEHIVVKKVLDAQGIFDDILETTVIPYEQQTQKTDVSNEQSLVEKNDEDYLVKTEMFDDYNQESIIKVDDRKAKLVDQDQNPDRDNYNPELNIERGNDREAKLVNEDQNPESDNYNQELNIEKGDDREAKLFQENQNPEVDNIEDDIEDDQNTQDQNPEVDNYNQESNPKVDDRKAKLVNEDQNSESDNYNQKLNIEKGDDREEELLNENQNPEVDNIEDDLETKLMHEDQNPEEQNTENIQKLVESKVISSNDEQSINLNNESQQEQQVHQQSYPNNEQEETNLHTNKESQSLPYSYIKLVDHTDNPQNSENKSPYDKAATFFEAYLPRDSGQTFNNNLADEFAGIGKALPISISDGSTRSTIIIVLSSGTALLFVVISITIFLISFQRQHGTLDIEMQERSCGKDDLDDEDCETFSKLLEVELPRSVALALDDTEECL